MLKASSRLAQGLQVETLYMVSQTLPDFRAVVSVLPVMDQDGGL